MALKTFGPVALVAIALTALASTASATTLEVNGVKQTGPVTIHAILLTGTSAILTSTGSIPANECSESTIEGTTTTPFTVAGTGKIGGPISKLTFSKCTEEPVVVDAPGYLTIAWISGTTNGTVFSDSAKITSNSPFGPLTCTTSATGTDLDRLTGKSAGSNATLDIHAILNCGFFLPSAVFEATYEVTSPTGLGVTE